VKTETDRLLFYMIGKPVAGSDEASRN